MERNTKNLKSVVFMVTQIRVVVYIPFFISSKCGSLFSSLFTAAIVLAANKKCNVVVVHMPCKFWKRLLKQYGAW